MGRNTDYAIALEGSLKLKEISYIHAEAYAAGELKHGTIALIEDMGVPTKIERGNRVFPQSDKAVDIVDALIKNATQCGAKIIEGCAKAFDFAIAQTVRCIELQVLCHPYLVSDSCVLVNLTIAGIGKSSTVRFSVSVHPFGRANNRRIEGVNGLLGRG